MINLSPNQRLIVEHEEGPLLVVAGPGSGKTRVLTERIRRLLTEVPGHFRVLALTFTNKAANEMKERLADLGEKRERAFIGTLHSFCLEMLSERGKPVGVDGLPQIFEQYKDRKEVLVDAVRQDPLLAEELASASDAKERNRRLDEWLRGISWMKAHPLSYDNPSDELDKRILDAYDSGMRACNAYDFDDLLLLASRLLNEHPRIADFYRRLYKFVCIDEAQDLNEAQYSVLKAICGDSFRNVMMVGDPKQSIYGFNTSSPDFMWKFRDEFQSKEINLNENFRSSQAVVSAARSLDPDYMVESQLPISGLATILVGKNEEHEAQIVVMEIERLISEGHEDVEGEITPNSCAVLGRTRFALMAVEKELRQKNISFYKRLSANHENESEEMEDFHLALRILGNPKDNLHLTALSKRWEVKNLDNRADEDALAVLNRLSTSSPVSRANQVFNAVEAVARQTQRLDMMPGIQTLRKYADTLPEERRRAIYEDATVFAQEWDQYLRSEGKGRSIAGFLSSKALGATQQASRDGIALLTVHSSKGLEFDVVFVVGMAEGVFPDYRALGKQRELEEEARNAFVAMTRSKRLLYLSFPKVKMMPWGDLRAQKPSRYLAAIS